VSYPRQSMLQLGHATEGYIRMQMVVASRREMRRAPRVRGPGVSDAGQDDLLKISRVTPLSPAGPPFPCLRLRPWYTPGGANGVQRSQPAEDTTRYTTWNFVGVPLLLIRGCAGWRGNWRAAP